MRGNVTSNKNPQENAKRFNVKVGGSL
jgi:hypothetical protein